MCTWCVSETSDSYSAVWGDRKELVCGLGRNPLSVGGELRGEVERREGWRGGGVEGWRGGGVRSTAGVPVRSCEDSACHTHTLLSTAG